MPRSFEYGRDALGFIDELARKATAGAVMDAVEGALAGFGFGNFNLGGLPMQCFERVAVVTRWPPEYQQVYVREHYVRVSPVYWRARGSAVPFEWCSADFARHPDPLVTRMMQDAADFGLAHGFTVPIHGPRGFEGCVSMAGTHVEMPPHLRPGLHLMALQAFERMRTILRPLPRSKPALTPREREVLAWVANGKSAWEIGEILSIAKRTVDEHAQTAFRKLGAVNRTQAVAIALRERIIDL
jgi:LuxR family transcriptional regulator, quorum-sensing system regulator BjaR1